VITTASQKNFAYVKKLASIKAFDYHSETIVDELVHAFKSRTIAGAYNAIARKEAFENCIKVVDRSNGDKLVVWINPVPEGLPSSIRANFIRGLDVKDNEVSKAVFNDFLPQALSEGRYIAAPEPTIVGKGLEGIQNGLDTLKKGVSAQKIVITS
jgi:hypothetical protein